MSREKEPAPGGRATNEIVEEIVDNLRPWKGGKSVAAITAAVNDQLAVLLKLAPLQAELFDRARNRAHARKLDDALSEVETLLASAPGALAWFLFDPYRGRRLRRMANCIRLYLRLRTSNLRIKPVQTPSPPN
jgi:hypothetical protein